MRFETIKVGFLEVNCYLIPVELENTLYIIDPGASPAEVARKAESFEMDNYSILLTHAHIDHIGGINELMDLLPVSSVFLHPADRPLFESPANELPPIMPSLAKHPETVTKTNSDVFKTIHTPGHTPGCVCFLFEKENVLFSGDTLFHASVGRTDLPGGDTKTLLESIGSKLLTLPENTEVFPGHGPATNIGWEKNNNPFL